MTRDFQVRPADIAAYIVFQFKALEATLNAYHLPGFTEQVKALKCAFIAHALESEAKGKSFAQKKLTPHFNSNKGGKINKVLCNDKI